jgi:OPA family glycerol-3-phosphate transporter-like MFS transporter
MGDKKGLWATLAVLAFFAVVCNLIKDGLMTWVPSILKKQYGFEDSFSIILTLALPLVGFGGVALVSQLKKKINGFVGLAGVLYASALLCLVGVLFAFNLTTWLPLLLFFALVYCFMSGVNNVVTACAPLYLRGQINSGVLAGILDGFCYAGSTISAYGLGAFADFFDWEAVFILLSIMAAIAVLCTLTFIFFERRRKNVQ